MAIIKHKSTTNGRRNMTSSDFAEVTKKKPKKTLFEPQSHTAGRNSYGHITIRHRGDGHKQKYRIINSKRSKDDVKAVIKAIRYGPNRTANIALFHYTGGIKAYILALKGLKVGTVVKSGSNADIKPGNALSLSTIPAGTEIHNIKLKPGKGGQLVGSAGTVARVLDDDGKHILVRLQSGGAHKILSTYRATVGPVGNEQHSSIQSDRASRKRWLGKCPRSRGSVMNSNDRPHGDGEDKAPTGRPQPMTPWGRKPRGIKTRNSKTGSEKLVIRHRKGDE